jgi:transcriptional regulator with XRE-family HTH domain
MSNAKTERSRSKRPLDHDPAKLRRLRFAAGLTLTALAERSGMNLSTLSGYENGRHSPSPRSLVRMANALDCKPADLMPDVQTAAA